MSHPAPGTGAVLGLLGRTDVRRAAPPLPTGTVESVRTDVATVRERVSR
jgi:hypothetical protein